MASLGAPPKVARARTVEAPPRVVSTTLPFEKLASILTPVAPRRIPLARPDIGRREVAFVSEVLDSGVLALGPFARRFELLVAALTDRREAVACSSGTAGLHMAVRGLELGEGDEVITTPFSFVASANCLLYERVRPFFVDIEEETLGLDPDLVPAAASRHTRGVLPVHVFGKPCRIDAITSIARQRGWVVIEDACEGLGSKLAGRPMGSFGDAAVFGFYPNKQITTGEGGILVTDDPALAETVRSLRNQGRDTDGVWLRHVRLGYNYRLDELSAALGVAQVERLATLKRRRASVAACYERQLAGRDWLRLPRAGVLEDVDWFAYVVRLEPPIDRDCVVERLAGLGVGSRPYFSPIHLQPFYQQTFGYKPGDFPVTERVAASTLALPFSTQLTETDVRYVVDALDASVREYVGR